MAGSSSAEDYLLDQANLRGFHGAVRSGDQATALNGSLSLEDIVVGLLMLPAEVDARILKLVVRILQSGQVDATILFHRARRERADHALYWLLHLIPPEEQTNSIQELLEAARVVPRGYRAPRYAYDSRRLIRRRATREDWWPRARR